MRTISCYPCHWCGCSENQCECTPGKKCCPDCDHRTLLERAERVIENGNSDSLFRELVAEIKGNEQQIASMNLDCANISHNLQLANVGINMVTAERDTLRAEVEKLRAREDVVAEASYRTGQLDAELENSGVRPMTTVESNLMTQVLDLRREKAQLRGALETIRGHCTDLSKSCMTSIGDILAVIERAGIES